MPIGQEVAGRINEKSRPLPCLAVDHHIVDPDSILDHDKSDGPGIAAGIGFECRLNISAGSIEPKEIEAADDQQDGEQDAEASDRSAQSLHFLCRFRRSSLLFFFSLLLKSVQSLCHFLHRSRSQIRIIGQHRANQNTDVLGKTLLFQSWTRIAEIHIGTEYLRKNPAQRPDVAFVIEGTSTADIGMAVEQILEHRSGPRHFRVEKPRQFIVDLDLDPVGLALEHQYIVENQVGNEVAALVQT